MESSVAILAVLYPERYSAGAVKQAVNIVMERPAEFPTQARYSALRLLRKIDPAAHAAIKMLAAR